MEENLNATYFRTLTNKLAIQVPADYMNVIYSLKKCNEESSQQFQLDLIELRTALTEFTNLPDAKGKKKKPPATFIKIVKKSFEKVETRLKVIGMPKTQIVDFYNKIVADRTEDDFMRILKLRGIKGQEVHLHHLDVEG